jgi:hypothetical protein
MTIEAAEREIGRRAFEMLASEEQRLTQSARGEAHNGPSRLAAVLRHLSGLEDQDGWKPAPEYESVALALVDSIWSIGVRYGAVLKVVARYTAARLEQDADARRDTPEDLLSFIAGCGSIDAFADAVDNHQRTSSRNGILKAEAVRDAAALLAKHGVRTPEGLRSLNGADLGAVQTGWCQIRGQRSGLSWEYFLMLCGISGVKADRHVRRFVAEALSLTESQVGAAEARSLVIEASDNLGIDWRVADYAIWDEMSGR